MPLPDVPHLKLYLKCVNNRLREKKIIHCLSTAEFLLTFAPALDLAEEQIVAAGLLHDICREYDNEKLLRKAVIYGIPLTDIEMAKPNLLHGPVAAEECRHKFGITDAAIYEAIYWHTTGKPGLHRLGQALYFADFSEPTRKYSEAAEARLLLAEDGFFHALLYVVRKKMEFFSTKQVTVPMAFEFFHWAEKEWPQ